MEQRPIAPDVSRSYDQRTPRDLEDFSYVDNQNTLRDLGDVSTIKYKSAVNEERSLN